MTLADSFGLHVRLTAGGIQNANVCGAAVNTEGVGRATVAVLADGRVFLACGDTFVVPGSDVSAIATAGATPATVSADKTSEAPNGMGTFLARLYRLAWA